MFHKPAQLKPFAAIKGSERKQIVARLEKQVNREFDPEEKLLLAPKSLQSARCVLKSGKKAQIYACEGHSMYVVLGDLLVPTVYTLQLVANLCPVVYTVPNTLKFLVSGADFMIPGIFGELPEAVKGSVVQIRTIDSNIVLAVGIALVDLSNVKEEDKGKAVEIVNVRGDSLVQESEMPKTTVAPQTDQQMQPTTPADQTEQPLQSTQTESKEDDDIPLATEEADDAFMYAAPKALATKQEYPMPSATFAKLLAQNFPYDHPGIMIKATSWKKLPKFLKHLEKEGLVTTKERNGDTIIESISDSLSSLALSQPESAKPKSKPVKKEKMECIQRYKVKSSGSTLASTNPYYTASEIKKLITQYITNNNLNDKGTVTIDDNLRKACGLKQDAETLIMGKVVEDFVKHSTSVFHQINRDGVEGKLAKGSVPHITLSTKREGGNKVVTRVTGLEAFGFSAKAVAETLRVVCAGSTTVFETTAGKNTKAQQVVQIQGDHVAKVGQYLEKEGVKSSWIKRA